MKYLTSSRSYPAIILPIDSLAAVNSLLPEATEIGELRLKKISDEKIAQQTGIKRTTANSRIKKAHQILKDEFEEFFPF